ncbi:Transcription initiation factor TFIID subunit [Trichophyton interdigitale]|uniref:Transcription initiation factor TFIID subunit n=1 Tax=Trichophyton interdigitale TaxID=101480 RepID=A0A9P4YEG6_9EURO|nr:Transcription initiation factor TFIID subunit [Trichophyton interdigitale]KAF3893867.1 Transcription initiation factor TFIID subunit [Trichophyton interdigitale]KAG8209252.1 Transcription initiation factor TFIID subunit [Trichophyton interdigitale]
MASPRPNATPIAGPSAPSTQPITPPAEPLPSSNPAAPASTTPAQIPSTSLQDSGKSRRPRDARLIHMLLASLGVTSYQERVPLQLLDFAYRYTSSTLQDAVYLATEGYPGELQKEGGGRAHAHQDGSNGVSLGALRMSIASRLHYQFQPGLPKEFLMDLAAERNRIMLPGVSRGQEGASSSATASGQETMMGGIRLPPERFCLTGVGWNMKGEWESEGEEEMEVDTQAAGAGAPAEKDAEEREEEDDEDGRMEDVFGHTSTADANKDEDKTMTDV